ncbi:hypothetical protein [Pelagicoccus sp. SDUM812005]|uniref:hypothetical protein n=1 Tax=Pelagicoccus sp. SDUM812005 TaxID=3041257 RepID=UPI00280DFF69|nr:hypothetical protein [Pelagicoccus sp. SDUM812005]MDQ8183874.1 hypothetical protein [Pelagicoccus sp. SDUM812005]
MNETDPNELLEDCSLLLEYSTGFKILIWFLIICSVSVCTVLIISAIMKHVHDVPEKQTIWFVAIVTFFGWAAGYLITYLPKMKKRIIVTKDFIRFGKEEIQWHELKKVRHSFVLEMLILKSKDTKFVFYDGLIGYDFLATLSKEKERANQRCHTTPASAPR